MWDKRLVRSQGSWNNITVCTNLLGLFFYWQIFGAFMQGTCINQHHISIFKRIIWETFFKRFNKIYISKQHILNSVFYTYGRPVGGLDVLKLCSLANRPKEWTFKPLRFKKQNARMLFESIFPVGQKDEKIWQ